MHSNIDLEKAEITPSYSNESCHQSKEQDFSLFSDSDTLSHKKLMTYRVFHNVGPKIMAYCSQNMSLMDFQNLLGAHQMWSIC